MPEFMLALRAACLKLRKERENSPRYTNPIVVFWMPKESFFIIEDCPLFSMLFLSWGRQEDNFGQIHQLRQQQQHAAYAWPHSQRLSLLDDWVGLLPSYGVGCLQECLMWRNVLTLCYPLQSNILMKLFKRAAWVKFPQRIFFLYLPKITVDA